ncbi:MAG: LysM peptidoglycan-binding domain-containing protein [Ilumatobacter sp.]|uniref:CIS tube protein n=1 Tax=Ilumatobacter sp. TaxID=1967498 RepID=UPI002622B214|nr:LysM peptidoglycan-binding domain-containing protein [Ilumatobacter sp.]MDJ0770655.1 LysM peptidoglycan-binding domain-containing protein [Ilumatobacter sp.]
MAIPMKLEKAKLVKVESGGGGLGAAAASMAASAATSAAGVEGMVPVVWNDSEMNFRFNPTQLTLNKSAEFQGQNSRSSEEGGQEQFSSTGTRTLGFTVLLDEWESPQGSDVGAMVETMQKWLNPEEGSDPPAPPRAMFIWGKFKFTGQIASANATFDLFRRDGTPARAEVQVSMKERPEGAESQNPTSGGPPGRRSHRVVEGDTLPSVAYQLLGDANLWRILAEMNSIDDPVALAPGRVILVPSRQDANAARRAAGEEAA